ncbi:MAG: protein kinase [Acidobacteria bacterium]|nr:protein kinase [Acidobacteriota bacterium]MDA1234312.1 protein kinase [Acidobacteriota bacterium]
MTADSGPEDRASVLSGLCEDETDLRPEVEKLLRLHDLPGGILTDGSLGEWLADAEPEQDLLSAGQIVSGRFKVRRLVGRGGMGEVYECEDQELQQRVALKALGPSERYGAANASSFKREIQLALRVTHPNVCRVFDIGRHDSGPRSVDFFTMELVEGETLADYLRRSGPLSPEQARPLILQIASGLGALHDCEIVHRDLKPSNVLLQRDESGVTRVVLTDFGIAHFIGDGAATGAAAAQITGTPAYMAPEQITGKAAGPATDLFSFGILLYEMLTGEKPFPDDNHRTAQPVQPRIHNPDIPRRWNLLILSCLQTDIGARPQSVDAVFQALDTARTKAADAHTVAAARPVRRKIVQAAVFLLSVAALWGVSSRYSGQRTTADIDRRVAILPIGIVGNDPELQVMADGLTETISSRLSQYEGLNELLVVVPTSEIRRLSVDAASNARGVLGVNYVVEGRLAAQDGRARLTLTLIDAERVVQQDSAVVDGELARILDLEDGAVRRIATLLDLQAQPDQLESIVVTSPGADEFYLQGKGYLQRSDDVDSLNHGVTLFKKTIGLNPNHARAHADLAQAYLFLYDRQQDPKFVELAEDASQAALGIDSGLPEALNTRGRVLLKKGDAEAAIEQFRKALVISPRSAESYDGLGGALEALQEYGQAEAAYRKAIALRPSDWVAYKRLGFFYYKRNEFAAAATEFQKVIDLAPDNSQGYGNLGVMQVFLDLRQDAARSFRKAVELAPENVPNRVNLGKLLADDGQLAEAVDVLAEAARRDQRNVRARQNLASALLILGRKNEASHWYAEANALLLERLKLNSSDRDALSTLAHNYAFVGNREMAMRYAQQALQLSGLSQSDKTSIALALLDVGKRGKARDLVNELLAEGVSEESLRRYGSLRSLIAAGHSS